jgi:uncharacterized protein (TIGR02300 family)
MPAKDLGSKHSCFKCSTKFYDLKKPVPVCPKCGADQRESPVLKAPSEKRSRAARPVEPVAPEVEELELDEELDEDEDEDDEDETAQG